MPQPRCRCTSGWTLLLSCLIFLASPEAALATQGHAGIEGVYVHQLAHIFFAFSMGTFIYWLRTRKLVKNTGWRNLQYAAFLFILWNADAFTVHLLEEQVQVMTVFRSGPLLVDIVMQEGFEWLGPVYYAAKLDHLLCVPAMLFLYLGLRKLLSAETGDRVRREAP